MFLSVRQSVTKPFVWAIIFWTIDGTRFIFGMHDPCDNDMTLTLDQVKGQILIKVRSDAIQNVFAIHSIHYWHICWFFVTSEVFSLYKVVTFTKDLVHGFILKSLTFALSSDVVYGRIFTFLI